jgi:type IV secretory pathway VirB2 component (pilin)
MTENPYESPDATGTSSTNRKAPFYVRQNALTWFAGSFALALAVLFIGPMLVMMITGDQFPLGETLVCMLASFVIFVAGTFVSIFFSTAKRSYQRKNTPTDE